MGGELRPFHVQIVLSASGFRVYERERERERERVRQRQRRIDGERERKRGREGEKERGREGELLPAGTTLTPCQLENRFETLSHRMQYSLVLKRQLPHKIVNLLFTVNH